MKELINFAKSGQIGPLEQTEVAELLKNKEQEFRNGDIAIIDLLNTLLEAADKVIK